MKEKIEEILDKLLERIQEGEDVESCLKDYPQLADELRPLLYIAVKIEDLPKPQPDTNAMAETVAKVRHYASTEVPHRRFSFKDLFTLRPVVTRTAIALLIVFVLGLTTVLVSADSLPGDPLYPIKLLSEKIHYAVTFDEKGKAELHIVFANRRTLEFESTFKAGEKIDRALLETMLEETAQAMKKSQNLSDERATIIKTRIIQCNKQQLAVLENTKQYACQCDIDTISAAINACKELHECLDCDPSSCGDPNCPHKE